MKNGKRLIRRKADWPIKDCQRGWRSAPITLPPPQPAIMKEWGATSEWQQSEEASLCISIQIVRQRVRDLADSILIRKILVDTDIFRGGRCIKQ